MEESKKYSLCFLCHAGREYALYCVCWPVLVVCSIVEQNLGPDGILLWNAMERCVLDYYGIGKMHTIRTNVSSCTGIFASFLLVALGANTQEICVIRFQVFTLALKASELAKPTLMKVIKGDTARNLREHGRRVEKPFMVRRMISPFFYLGVFSHTTTT